MTEEEFYRKGYELRKSQRTEPFLRGQMNVRNHLAHFGWFEFPEPEEGEGTSIAHLSDLETSIRGYVMNDSVIFDPGEDFVEIKIWAYPSIWQFIEAVKVEFNKLVTKWYL